MNFSTNIQAFNTEYNLNAINEYNKFLQGHASFDIETNPSEFGKALENENKDFWQLNTHIDTFESHMKMLQNQYRSGINLTLKEQVILWIKWATALLQVLIP